MLHHFVVVVSVSVCIVYDSVNFSTIQSWSLLLVLVLLTIRLNNGANTVTITLIVALFYIVLTAQEFPVSNFV